ncbi:hypothetical protein SISNIDRAFT_482249 [Sistotremastrum niveocremeum HHB9708]|uniref:Uncharacterized protein n=1 Tax=Sistotremastrum niveocremeum HHB9708 TaxID=1314777 RepID=A0A164YXJ6_9AGAM|nr:hypothetical protein SISNIDRAFT_482249 [Sistotremastrum niveocremeum HHB9708]
MSEWLVLLLAMDAYYTPEPGLSRMTILPSSPDNHLREDFQIAHPHHDYHAEHKEFSTAFLYCSCGFWPAPQIARVCCDNGGGTVCFQPQDDLVPPPVGSSADNCLQIDLVKENFMSGSHSIAYYDILGDYMGDYTLRVGSGPEATTEVFLCMAGPNSEGELITWCCDTSGDDQFCTGLLGSGPCIAAGGPATISDGCYSEDATSTVDPVFIPAPTLGGSQPSPPTTSSIQSGSQSSSGPPFTGSSSSSSSSSISTTSLSPNPSPSGSSSNAASSPSLLSSSSTSTGTSSSSSQAPSTLPLSDTDTSSNGSSRALPTGAIVGIAVGSAVALLLLYFIFRRCRSQNRHIHLAHRLRTLFTGQQAGRENGMQPVFNPPSNWAPTMASVTALDAANVPFQPAFHHQSLNHGSWRSSGGTMSPDLSSNFDSGPRVDSRLGTPVQVPPWQEYHPQPHCLNSDPLITMRTARSSPGRSIRNNGSIPTA